MSQKRKPATGFIFVTLVLMIMGMGILIPVLPGLVIEFKGKDVSEGSFWYGFLVACYATMQFIAAPILGSLSDKYGRRRVLLTALAGSAIDYVIMGFATSLGWLFVARLISGVTAGALATCNAYIADVTPPEKRAASFGLVGAAFGIGFVLGPVLGGFLGGISLRLPFFAAAFLVGVNWLYGAFVLPESLPLENRRPFSWKRANPIGSLIVLRKFRGVADLAWMYFIYMFGQVMLQTTWVIYTGYRYRWSLQQISLSLMLAGITAGVIQGTLVKGIIARIGERKGLVLGLVLVAIAFAGYGFSPVGWMIYGFIIIGGFGGIAGPATQALVTRHVPADQQGAVQGSLSSLLGLATMFAPLVAAESFRRFTAPNAWIQVPGIAFYEASFLMLIAIGLAFASFRADDKLSRSHASTVS